MARLIKREESYSIFIPHVPEIIKVSEKLFEALQFCTGINDITEIAEQISLSDKSSLFDAFIEFEKTGIINFEQRPNRFDKTIEVTNAQKMQCRTAIYHITLRCNLFCHHCYASSSADANIKELSSTESSEFIKSFSNSGGLFLDFTGGEALLRNDIFDQMALAKSLGLRVGLLSNGILINNKTATKLKDCVHEVTISLDGINEVHDRSRGEGSYRKAILAIEKLVGSDIDTSVTTLITDASFKKLDEIEELLLKLGVKQWNLSVPRESGRARKEGSYLFDSAINCLRDNDNEIEVILNRIHERASNSALKIVLDESLLCSKLREKVVQDLGIEYETDSRCCWDNVITILPNGNCVACVFFKNLLYGNVKEVGFPNVLNSPRCVELKDYFHMTFKPGICPHLALSSCFRNGIVFPKPIITQQRNI